MLVAYQPNTGAYMFYYRSCDMYETTSLLLSKQGSDKAKMLSVNYYGFSDTHCDTIAKEMTVVRQLN